MEKIDILEVILKVTEVCNINCTYCYYFNGSNNDFEDKPGYISATTVDEVALFLQRSIADNRIDRLQIDLHGGEPMMLKKPRFRAMLQTFRRALDPVVDLRIALQTNGMLIDDEWISIFEEHKVSASISLDGVKEVNDLYRVDHRGRGTYDRAVRGLDMLKDAACSRRVFSPGVISVISPESDGARVYDHFVNDLGIDRLHLLLPDYSHDNFDPTLLPGFEAFVSGALERWLASDMERIRIRMFDFAWVALTRNAGDDDVKYGALTIRSDGMLNPPDDLRNAIPHAFDDGFPSITTSLSEFLDSPTMTSIKRDLSMSPPACDGCGFLRVCKGGTTFNQPEHQHSRANGFVERSVYCSVYQIIFMRLIETLVSRGYPWRRIEATLTGGSMTKIVPEVLEMA